MSMELKEELKKRKERNELQNGFIDLLCEFTQDKHILCYRDISQLYEKMAGITLTKGVTSEQYGKLIEIIKQFDNIINDFIEDEKIKIEIEE